mgnify:FL=1
MSDNRLVGYIFASVAILALIYAFGPKNLLTFNMTGSVPVGIYMKASPERARYVSFCLKDEHVLFTFYEQFCSPDNPERPAIIKRLFHRWQDGGFTVEGDTLNAIDTRLIGKIYPSQVRGYWRPLLVF